MKNAATIVLTILSALVLLVVLAAISGCDYLVQVDRPGSMHAPKRPTHPGPCDGPTDRATP